MITNKQKYEEKKENMENELQEKYNQINQENLRHQLILDNLNKEWIKDENNFNRQKEEERIKFLEKTEN